MKKVVFVLCLALLGMLAVSCASSGTPSESDTNAADTEPAETAAPAPTLIKEIPAQTKGYFGETDSSRVIDLADYVDEGGADVTYTAESSDESAVTVSLDGTKLTATVLSAEAEATVTVTASADGVDPLTLTFPVKGVTFKKIVCVGDSLTYGHRWPTEAYPVYLNRMFSDIRIAGFGSNGAAITGLLPDEDGYMDREPYPKSLAYNPDIVVALFGTNDIRAWDLTKDAFVERYLAFLDTYKAANPDVKFIVITPPPTIYDDMNARLRDEVRPMLFTMCEENGITVVDFNEAMVSLEDGGLSLLRTEDGLHLTVEGANMLASLVADAIRQQ